MTRFSSVPIGSIVMRIRSPGLSVKSLGGTIPVPVSSKHPAGKNCRCQSEQLGHPQLLHDVARNCTAIFTQEP